MKELAQRVMPFLHVCVGAEGFNFSYLQDRLLSQQDEGAYAMHQERQIEPCELSVFQAVFSCSNILGITTTLLWSLPKLCLSDLLKV